MRADLTLDVTVNTDFAQVEADEQQVNLTRFPLFFPEKRPFFLENAQMFQLGQPQAVDLFFSRRIGLSASGRADRHHRRRAAERKAGRLQRRPAQHADRDAVDDRTGQTVRAGQQLHCHSAPARSRADRTLARCSSTARASASADADDYNRAYGLDLGWQATTNGKLFAFLARTDSPESKGGSDYAGRALTRTPTHCGAAAAATRRWATGSIRKSAFCGGGPTDSSRAGTTSATSRSGGRGSAAFSRTPTTRSITNLQNKLESSPGHWHFFDIQTRTGARFGYLFETQQDRPRRPFTVYQDVTGRRVVIPPGEYAWTTGVFEGHTESQRAASASLRQRVGSFTTAITSAGS